MAVIGIDQSLTGTGLCSFLAPAAVSMVTVDPGARRGPERLAFIKEQLLAFVGPLTISRAAFEGYSYGSVGRVFELGEVGGVLRLTIHERGTPYVQVAPAALKKFATGNAAAEKDAVIAAARMYGVAPADDNQADAFFLALIAWHLETGAPPKTRHQLEVLKKLRTPSPKKPPRRIRKLVPNAV